MVSAPKNHDDGYQFPFLNLPSEVRHCVYRFVMPYTIRPRQFPLEMIFEAKDVQKPPIALFLINKQVHEEISYVLYRYSHFLISINPGRVTCVALESSIIWELDQTERMSVRMASSIRHIDIDLVWGERRSITSAMAMSMRLVPLLEYVCEHLRAFQCLQTLTVRWNKGGILKSRPRVDLATFILEPLEQLQADLPGVQITVEATQQPSNSETGDNPDDLEAYVKLQDYLSELRRNGKHPNMMTES